MNKMCVQGQKMYPFKALEPVPKSQVGFSEVEFMFDSFWDEYPTRTAQFSQQGHVLNVLLENNKCYVPSGLNVGPVTLSVRGDGPSSSIAAANCLTIDICCSFEDGGVPPVPPDPDLYNKLLSQVGEAAKSAYPKGGLKGQVLTKMSDADKDFDWSDVGGTGTAGGYYTPEVTQPSDDTMQVSFTASKDNMPPVEPVSVTLPAGPAGKDGEDGAPGLPGQDGYSPTVQTEPTEGGTRVTITDATGPKTFEVLNGTNGQDGQPGQDGTPGQDGFSPIANVTQTADGAKITITDKSGTTNATITNGKDGTNGTDGQTPNITPGNIETLPAGSDATASITGQTPNLVLNLGIPAGPAGAGVPSTEGVPTDYLLSPAGWVAPPSGGGSNELITLADFTVEGDAVASIVIDKDPEGRPFCVRKIYFLILPALLEGGETGNFPIWIHAGSTNPSRTIISSISNPNNVQRGINGFAIGLPGFAVGAVQGIFLNPRDTRLDDIDGIPYLEIRSPKPDYYMFQPGTIVKVYGQEVVE